jgi:hypothetical protein
MAGAIWYHRPAWWAWPLMAACLAYPSSTVLVLAANPTVWIAGFIALGTVWRPAFALVLLKPSLFPFALFGVRSRGWWGAVGLLALASLLLAPMTIDYLRALFNARGPMATVFYSAGNLPLLAIPLVAWAGSTRGRRMPGPQHPSPLESSGATAETPSGPIA